MSHPKELLNPKQTKLTVLAAFVTAGTLLSACGTPAYINAISSRKREVPEMGEGAGIRPMTEQELVSYMNNDIKEKEKKIALIIPLPKASQVASLTLLGACANGGCIPIEGAAGSGIIDGLAMTAGAATELGYMAVSAGAYVAPAVMILTNMPQGMAEGFYELNPRSGQIEQVNPQKGAYDRAKAVIEFFRDSRTNTSGVKFGGKEIARVETAEDTNAQTARNTADMKGNMQEPDREQMPKVTVTPENKNEQRLEDQMRNEIQRILKENEDQLKNWESFFKETFVFRRIFPNLDSDIREGRLTLNDARQLLRVFYDTYEQIFNNLPMPRYPVEYYLQQDLVISRVTDLNAIDAASLQKWLVDNEGFSRTREGDEIYQTVYGYYLSVSGGARYERAIVGDRSEWTTIKK